MKDNTALTLKEFSGTALHIDKEYLITANLSMIDVLSKVVFFSPHSVRPLDCGRGGEAMTGCPSCHTAPRDIIKVDGKPFSPAAALKAGKKCGQCHLQVTKGNGMTPKERCCFCHVDRTEKYGDVKLLHETHVGRKQVDCLWCHDKIEHGKIKVTKAAL